MRQYRHRQVGWVIYLTTAVPASIVVVAALATDAWFVLVALVPMLIVLVIFGSLTIEIDDEAITARFGVSAIQRRFALDDIVAAVAVRNPWRWGWGIRYIPGGRLYNVSGTGAVELALFDGRRIRLGTDEPHRLLGALQAVRRIGSTIPSPELPSTTGATMTPVTLVVAMIVVLAMLPGFFALRDIRMTTADGTIAINGGGYGARVKIADVTGLHVDDQLPPIRYRSNGLGFWGRLRGRFVLRDGRRAQLFVTRQHPPFLTIETTAGPVIVNFDDASRTRALYTQLTSVVH